MGCRLTAEERSGESPDGLTVTGNRCPRGAVYAREEIRAPKRVVTATCVFGGAELPCRSPDIRRLPVKSAVPCPKERISALLSDIYRLRLAPPVKSGDVVLSDWQGTGIDVVAVRTVE
jgi:CxxC motif-containing protein